MEINYNGLTSVIRGQFIRLQRETEKYENLSIYVDDEQAFLSNNALDLSDNLFIVLQYGEARTSLGSVVLSVTFRAIGLKDEVETARQFLTDFATAHNNSKISNDTILVCNTPSVSTDFEQAGNGYRNLYSMSGVLVIGTDTIDFASLTFFDEESKGTEIPLLSFQDSTTNTPTPQVYSNSNGRTNSYIASQTYTFSITTYSLNNALIKKVNEVKYSDEAKENTSFVFTLALNDGTGFKKWSFKLASATFSYSIGNLCSVGLTFTL